MSSDINANEVILRKNEAKRSKQKETVTRTKKVLIAKDDKQSESDDADSEINPFDESLALITHQFQKRFGKKAFNNKRDGVNSKGEGRGFQKKDDRTNSYKQKLLKYHSPDPTQLHQKEPTQYYQQETIQYPTPYFQHQPPQQIEQ